MLGRHYTPDVVSPTIEPSVLITSPEIEWSNYQAQAQALLIKSDSVAIRCGKKGIAFPANWQAYDDALRVIVDPKDTAGDPTLPLPTQPVYPQGT